MIRVELTLMDRVVLCKLYAIDGRLLGSGRGYDEDTARTEAALDYARNEALLDERIARELAPFKPRGATKARLAADAARLGKLRPDVTRVMRCGCAWGTLLCPH